MNTTRRIGINMLSGGAGYVVPMVINIFSTPYIIRSLGEEGYGLQALGSVIIGYLVVADMGLDIPVTRKVAEYYARKEDQHQSRFLIATLKLYLLIGLFGMIVVLISTEKLITVLSIPDTIYQQARIVFYLTSFGFLGSILAMWGRAVFNGIHRYDIANAISILNNLFGVVLGLFLVVKGYGVIGFFAARILGFILASFAYIFWANKYITKFNLFPIVDKEIWQHLKTQIGFGILLRMSGLVFAKMDQALISILIGIAMVGVYSVPLLIASTLSGLIGSVTHFAFPMASSIYATKSLGELESFFTKLSKFIAFTSTLVFVPFIILGKNFLTLWISPSISEQSQQVFTLLLLAFYLNACLNIALNSFIVGIGQLKYFTTYAVSRSLLLFLGFITLIKIFGVDGAGISYLLSVIADLIFFLLATKNKLHFNANQLLKKSYLKSLTLGGILSVPLIFLKPFINTWFELICASSLFIVLYLSLGLAIGIVDNSERKVLFSMLKKK